MLYCGFRKVKDPLSEWMNDYIDSMTQFEETLGKSVVE